MRVIRGPWSRLGSLTLLLAASALSPPTPASAQAVDRQAIDRIIDEGTRHTQVMVTAEYLTDMIGPRLTNSPGARKAEAWTQAILRGWGLANVRTEGFDFGRGWWIERSDVRMLTPRPIQLTAIPLAWSPPTPGTLTAPVIVAPMTSTADFAPWRGKLAGRIVLVSPPGAAKPPIAFSRQSAEDLAQLETYAEPGYDPAKSQAARARTGFPRALDAFLKREGALAYATMSRLDGKLVHGEGYGFAIGDTPAVPAVEIAAEDYRRIVRLTLIGQVPTLAIASLVHYDDSDPQGYNVLADIPGRDPKAGYVMAGGHLDSWAAADGATDDGAGIVMVMEAARILATMPKPKRTIRFALWGGEEQGYLGMMAYADRHLAARGTGADDSLVGHDRFADWFHRWPIVPRPGWSDLAAYFNLDMGTGKIRGLFDETSSAIEPIFREWLAPFASMGADHVAGNTRMSFLADLGVPGFEFIQDWGDYGRTHHTSMDTYDHLDPADLRQGSIVLAGILWSAANADRPLPRRPLPTKPVVADPFIAR